MSWIEFTGEVGAGKTTLAAAFRRQAESCGYRALSPEEAAQLAMERTLPGRWLARLPWTGSRERVLGRLYRWFAAPLAQSAFARQHAELMRQVDRSERARRTLPDKHRGIIRRLFFDVAALYQFALPRLKPGELVVLDEGFAHRAVNLFAWEPGEVDVEAVHAYLDCLPVSGLIVMVNAPEGAALERAQARGLPVRLRDKDPEVVQRFITHTGEIIRIAADRFAGQTLHRRQLVTVENSGAPEPLAVELVKIADRQLRSNGKPSTAPVFTSGPFLRLPRPDRLLARLRFQRQMASARAQDPTEILTAWNLHPSGPAQRTGGPGRSGSWMVPTSAGLKVLKRYKPALDRDWVLHEHSILQALAAAGFPAPRLVPAGGATLVERDGGIFALFEAYEGYFHYHNSLFLPGMAQQFVSAAGKTLAALHLVLRGCTPEGRNPNGFISISGGRWRELDWYFSKLERCADSPLSVFKPVEPGKHPVTADWIRERLQVLDETLKHARLEKVIAHGDYGPYNLLFRQGSPVVVLDFELARLDWRLTDLSAALYYFARGQAGFHWKKMRWFVDAYRSMAEVSAGELEHLASVWQFLTLRRLIVLWERSLDKDRAALEEVKERLDLLYWLEQHEKDLKSL
ncbi:MAG TPA: phosphotransferase [Terriglobales bacterium]